MACSACATPIALRVGTYKKSHSLWFEVTKCVSVMWIFLSS